MPTGQRVMAGGPCGLHISEKCRAGTATHHSKRLLGLWRRIHFVAQAGVSGRKAKTFEIGKREHASTAPAVMLDALPLWIVAARSVPPMPYRSAAAGSASTPSIR